MHWGSWNIPTVDKGDYCTGCFKLRVYQAEAKDSYLPTSPDVVGYKICKLCDLLNLGSDPDLSLRVFMAFG